MIGTFGKSAKAGGRASPTMASWDARPAASPAEPVRLEAVCFDLDNTLIPFFDPLRTWTNAWAQHAVLPCERSDVAEALIHHTLDGPEDRARAIQRVSERWRVNGARQPATERAEQAYRTALAPYPGIVHQLDELERSGYSLAVVTDAPRGRAIERLEATGLARRFETIITLDDTPRGKRGPEPFELALDRLGLPAHEVGMVGDWPVYDVRWPKRLGMRTVLARWGQAGKPCARDRDAPWAIAETPEQVVAALGAVRQPSLASFSGPEPVHAY